MLALITTLVIVLKLAVVFTPCLWGRIVLFIVGKALSLYGLKLVTNLKNEGS